MLNKIGNQSIFNNDKSKEGVTKRGMAKFDRHDGDLLILKSYRKLDEKTRKENERKKLKNVRTFERNAAAKYGIPKIFKKEGSA